MCTSFAAAAAAVECTLVAAGRFALMLEADASFTSVYSTAPELRCNGSRKLISDRNSNLIELSVSKVIIVEVF